MDTNQDIKQMKIDALNDLIQACKAGEFGFSLAAEEVEKHEYRSLFQDWAVTKLEFASALQEQVQKMGGAPVDHSTLQAAVHRTWMNLRHLLKRHDDNVVLNECRRGEESALKAYQDVFEQKLLPEIDPILKEQFLRSIEMRDKLLGFLKITSNLQAKKEESFLHL
jgi:uncharacterized protein (TIGR02284 family)